MPVVFACAALNESFKRGLADVIVPPVFNMLACACSDCHFFGDPSFYLRWAEEAALDQTGRADISERWLRLRRKSGALFERVMDLNRVQELTELNPDEMRSAFQTN